MSTVIDSLNDDGGVPPFRKHSTRLAAFMARYGPDQGYAVVIDATDSLSLQPGLLRLYEQAIACGQAPEVLGLPPLTGDCTMVFRARLEDSQGRVLATASAVKPILDYRDFEAGEAAARQRLLAALGFSGEEFDADEAVGPSEPDTETGQTAPVDNAVPPALTRQIAHLAKLKNRDVPAYGTVQEAREALKRLMAT